MRTFCGILTAIALLYTVAFPILVGRSSGDLDTAAIFAIFWGATSLALYCMARGMDTAEISWRPAAWLIRIAYGILGGFHGLLCAFSLIGSAYLAMQLPLLSSPIISNAAEARHEALIRIATATITGNVSRIMRLPRISQESPIHIPETRLSIGHLYIPPGSSDYC